jgi:hypothetical protein
MSPTKEEQNDWIIKYYPGKRALEEIKRFDIRKQLELPFPEKEISAEDKLDLPNEKLDIVGELVYRGIAESAAVKLIESHTIEQIQMHIEIFDWLKDNKKSLIGKNAAGFLRKSIEENYQPPEEFTKAQERERIEKNEQERRERWTRYREELINQDIENWDKKTPEDRVKGMLDFWITGQKLNGIDVTSDQIKAKKKEMMDNLPQIYEEKWEYIARSYPEEPPVDFA